MRAQLKEAVNRCSILHSSLWVQLWEFLDLLVTSSKIIRECLGTLWETKGHLWLPGKDKVRGAALAASNKHDQLPLTQVPRAFATAAPS